MILSVYILPLFDVMSARHHIKENIGCPREGRSPTGDDRGGGCPLMKIVQKINFGQFSRKGLREKRRRKETGINDFNCMTCG